MSFFRKNVQRVRAIAHNPRLLSLWLGWRSRRIAGIDPSIELLGSRFGGFADFSSFVGAWHSGLSEGERSFICKQSKSTRTLFDVGANFGVISCLLARTYPEAIVYAFEPHPVTSNACRANFERNMLKNVRLFETAVSSSEGSVGFSDTMSAACNHIVPSDEPGALVLPATTLDAFCLRNAINRIDFLKVDAEGADVDVLHGAHDLFSRGAVSSGMVEVNVAALKRFGRTVADLVDFFAVYHLKLGWCSPDGEVGDPVPRLIADTEFSANAVFGANNDC